MTLLYIFAVLREQFFIAVLVLIHVEMLVYSFLKEEFI